MDLYFAGGGSKPGQEEIKRLECNGLNINEKLIQKQSCLLIPVHILFQLVLFKLMKNLIWMNILNL